MSGLLHNKNVAIFAATGAIGSAVAEAAISEGASVHLSGHRAKGIDRLRSRFGDAANYSEVDATNPSQVQCYLDDVVAPSGPLDAVFNGIGGRPHLLGYPEPLERMSISQFMIPLERILGSTFITSTEAGIRMRTSGKGGAIVTLSATLSAMTGPNMANLTATCAAIEGLTRSMAGELGPAGIRVNCVRGSAMPETRTIQETSAEQALLSDEPPSFSIPPLGRPITVAETANTAIFLMSDMASGTTGQVLTVCAGQFV